MAEDRSPRSTGKETTTDTPDKRKEGVNTKPQKDTDVPELASASTVDVKDEAPKNVGPKEPRTRETLNREQASVATEKPVIAGAAPQTSQYVVTVDNRTQLPVKIERLNQKTGERTELSKEEYAAIYPLGRPGGAPVTKRASGAAFSGSAASLAGKPDLMEAYYRGVADYLKAITSI